MAAAIAGVLAVTLLVVAVAVYRWQQSVKQELRETRGKLSAVTSSPAETTVDRPPTLAALDQVPTGVIIADRTGQEVSRNQAAIPYATGRHGDAIIEQAVQRCLTAAVGGLTSEEEVRLHDTPIRVLHVAGAPLVADGDMIGGMVVVDDMSEQHRLDAVRRDFVANVSHELRTPVGALSLLAEMLEGENDPEVLDRFIGRMQTETTRLSGLIDDLLDLSRIEVGLGEDASVVDLPAVLQDAVAGVRETAQHKNIALELDLHDAPSVFGVSGQLGSAVMNLLSNAIKYSPAGSAVEVRLRSLGDEVAVAVVDSGIGIPQKDVSRVFERFYRVDQGRSSETGGTGLGLAIVRHVVVNHGGRVEVASQEGVGSTFTLVLPAHDAPPSGV